jgi:hypothetical protein
MLTDKLDCCSDAVEVSVVVACFVFDGVKFHNSLPLLPVAAGVIIYVL